MCEKAGLCQKGDELHTPAGESNRSTHYDACCDFLAKRYNILNDRETRTNKMIQKEDSKG